MTAIADILRLIVIPVFAWTAWRDIKTRRIPNRVWPPLLILGGGLLIWETIQFTVIGTPGGRPFFIRTAISLFIVAPFGYLFWWSGAYGAADGKAMITLAVLFPTFPQYAVGDITLPITDTTLGVFSLTILTNAVLLAIITPLGLGVRNLLARRIEPKKMLLARPVHIDSLSDLHGRLFESVEGRTYRGADLDVLRMYLRWRGTPLDALREHPDTARNPSSITETNDPTDGRVATNDQSEQNNIDTDATVVGDGGEETTDDAWGVEQFFDDIDGPVYRTDVPQLREGLELLATTENETVWVSPGLPFIVPMFAGVLVALVYGDILFTVLEILGVVTPV